MSKDYKIKSLQEVQRENVRKNNQKKSEIKVVGYILLTVVVLLVSSIFFISLGKKQCLLKVGKNEIGYVENNNVAMDIIAKTKKQIEQESGTEIKIIEQPSIDLVKTGKKADKEEKLIKGLKDKMKYNIKAYTLIIDGKALGCLSKSDEINQVLNEIKNKYDSKKSVVDFVGNSSNLKLWFKENVEIENNYVNKDKIAKVKDMVAILSEVGANTEVYVVKEGDIMSKILEKYDSITLNDIKKMNEGFNPDKLSIGQKINISSAKLLLSVITREEKTYEEVIPKAEEIKKNEEKPTTYREVIKEGKQGKKKIKLNIIKVNGVEEGKEVISEDILVEPVTEVIEIGTKKLAERSYPGIFAMPTIGEITSRFGELRDGHTHQGIDIANDEGTSIYSVGTGKVLTVGYDAGGYGNYVKITHSNGYETLYGHLSKIMVSEGDSVTKKDKIGLMGNTGRSTGSHLHLEVI
ncbi:MAG TPA: hypothetical protein DEG71_01595, partial [Clostridiales bacterium]|nr:hypothetical protein [Clostridiales bacterium]